MQDTKCDFLKKREKKKKKLSAKLGLVTRNFWLLHKYVVEIIH